MKLEEKFEKFVFWNNDVINDVSEALLEVHFSKEEIEELKKNEFIINYDSTFKKYVINADKIKPVDKLSWWKNMALDLYNELSHYKKIYVDFALDYEDMKYKYHHITGEYNKVLAKLSKAKV